MSLKFHNFYIKYLLLCSAVFEVVIVVEAIAEQAFLSLLLFSAFNILGFITGYVLQKQRRVGLQLIKIRSIIGIVIASISYLLTLANFYLSGNEMFKNLKRTIAENPKDAQGFFYIENFFSTISATSISILGGILCGLFFLILLAYIICQICILKYYAKRKSIFMIGE